MYEVHVDQTTVYEASLIPALDSRMPSLIFIIFDSADAKKNPSISSS